MRAPACLLVLVLTLVESACGPNVDVKEGLQIPVVNTGWFDAGIVNGQNRLVPAKFVLSKRKPIRGIAESSSPKASWMFICTKGTSTKRPHMP